MNKPRALAALAAALLCMPLAVAHASEGAFTDSHGHAPHAFRVDSADPPELLPHGRVEIETRSGARRWVPLEATGLFSASDLTADPATEREQRVERTPQSTSSAETPPVLGWLAGFMVLLGAGCVVRRRQASLDERRAAA